MILLRAVCKMILLSCGVYVGGRWQVEPSLWTDALSYFAACTDDCSEEIFEVGG